jgi:hypothetical protein
MHIKALGWKSWLVGALVSFVAFLYLITSAVVVINAFVWLPTFPSFWYAMQRIIYWPWQPYFDLAYAVLGRSNISYRAYAILIRAPFLVVPIAVIGLTVRRWSGGRPRLHANDRMSRHSL